MIAAVFDVDRTLLPGTTAERIFLRFLLRQRNLGLRSLLATGSFLIQNLFRSPLLMARAHRPYLTGQHVARLRLLGEQCYERLIAQKLSSVGLNRIHDHKAAGHVIVLLSGSLPYVIEPMARSLAADHAICSDLVERDQRLAGGLARLHPYGVGKAELMREFAVEHAIDLAHSYCYADHHSDEPLLSLFGLPVCVNPDDGLLQVARRNGWAVEQFK